MADITFTDFMNIVQSAGVTKFSKIQNVKSRGAYSPSKDYYKPLRQKIIELCESSGNIEDVSLEIQAANKKKWGNYEVICKNIIAWKKKNKNLSWISPPKGYFKPNVIGIKVNPELAFQMDSGNMIVIKLHMNKEPLSKGKLQIAAHLLQKTLGDCCPDNTNFVFLDLHQGKIFPVKGVHESTDAFLAAEIAYIEYVWNNA